MKISIFKKFSLLREYKKTINLNKDFIFNKYKIKVDRLYRCYTVFNIPYELKDNIKKYGYYYVDGELRKYLKELENFFQTLGLFELIGVSKIDQIDEFNILIVLEFKLLNIRKLKIIKYITISSLILASIISLFLIF